MSHSHNTARQQGAKRALTIAIIFIFSFMIIETIYGIKAHSLAVITDAVHLLTDVASLSLSLFATIAATWAGNPHFSFGWARAEVVGAMASLFMIWGLVVAVLYEAISRVVVMAKCSTNTEGPFTECEGIEAPIMLGIGCAGLLVNFATAAILLCGGHAHSHSHGGHSHGGHDDDEEEDHGHSHGNSLNHDHGHCHGGNHDHSHGGNHDHSHGGNHDHSHGGNHDHSHGGHDHSHGDHGHHCARHQVSSPRVDDEEFNENRPLVTSATPRYDNGSGPESPPQSPSVPGAWTHHHDAEVSLNVRGAMLHALSDCLQSVAVIVAACICWFGAGKDPQPRSYYNLADPICSILFAIMTVWTTRHLTQEVFHILMECTPRGVSHSKLLSKLETLAGVESVHDLHVWSLAPGTIAMSVHLVSSNHRSVLKLARELCAEQKIFHTTIQVDPMEIEELHQCAQFHLEGRERMFACSH